VISETVYQAAGLNPADGEKVTLPASDTNSETTAILTESAPALPASWTPIGDRGRAALRRLRSPFVAG
jgi:hypothetical protein